MNDRPTTCYASSATSNPMIPPFLYQAVPSRVQFGPGKLRALPAELDLLNIRRALIITTPRAWRDLGLTIHGLIGDRLAEVFTDAVMHVPLEVVTEAMLAADAHNADGLIAIGGGSSTGLAKAMVLRKELPIVAIPTTYAGSEVTAIWGVTEGGEKRTGRDLRVLPKTVIYDPELTLSLPPKLSATSGINALAHCVEAFYAAGANPVTSLLAEEGIRALAAGLPKVVAEPNAIEGRTETLYGAWLAGIVLGTAGVALHHKLCHVLGGSFGLPHAETHTVILPYATAYNAKAAPEAMQRIAAALGAEPAPDTNAPQAIQDLAKSLHAPISLMELGFRESDLDRAADLAVQNPYFNPAPVTREGVRELLGRAFLGLRPAR